MARIKKREFGRPVGQQRSRGFMLTIGLAGLLLAAVTFYVGYQAAYTVPGRGYYNFKAEFKDANNLANHYEVRVGGVRAGQILDPRSENGRAVVDVRLDDKFKPLKDDSTMQVRLRSAVGVRYLEIRPGTKGAPLPDGGTLKSEQVEDSVALDQVLGTFDKQTRDRTTTMLRELGATFNDRGTDVNETIGTLPGLLAGLKGVSQAVTDRPNKQLSGFIRSGTGTADAFDRARFDIVNGFKLGKEALRVFSDAKSGVQGTLETAPGALGSLESNLPQVDRLLGEVQSFSRDSRPTFRAAPVALTATTRLLDDSHKPFNDFQDTLGFAQSTVNPVLGLLDKIDPVLPTINKTTDVFDPILTELGPKACEISNATRSWSQYLGIGDSETDFIRFHFLGLRPEQTAGQASKGPADSIYDSFVNSDPYFGPCTNNGSEGATGLQQPVTGRLLSAGAHPFTKNNVPYETDPNIVSSPAQVDLGGN